MTKSEKFRNNPAMQMLGNYTESENEVSESIEPKIEAAPKPTAKNGGFKPMKVERRTEKKIILITPTLSEKLKEKAKEYKLSVNELINQILETNV